MGERRPLLEGHDDDGHDIDMERERDGVNGSLHGRERASSTYDANGHTNAPPRPTSDAVRAETQCTCGAMGTQQPHHHHCCCEYVRKSTSACTHRRKWGARAARGDSVNSSDAAAGGQVRAYATVTFLIYYLSPLIC